VYGLPSNGSTDGEDDKMSESDIEGQGDDIDDLPDTRAWGQKRRNFYNTDYVDQDYGGLGLLPISHVSGGSRHFHQIYQFACVIYCEYL
jgi:hypothetical protein